MKVVVEILRGVVVGATADHPDVSVEVLNLDDLHEAPLDSVEREIAERVERLEYDAIPSKEVTA